MPPDTPIRGKKGEIWGLEVTDIYNWFKAPIWEEVDVLKGLEDCLREASLLGVMRIMEWDLPSTGLLGLINYCEVTQWVWNKFWDTRVPVLEFWRLGEEVAISWANYWWGEFSPLRDLGSASSMGFCDLIKGLCLGGRPSCLLDWRLPYCWVSMIWLKK